MEHDGYFPDRNISVSFAESTLPKSVAIIELIRHLARISAENDYNAFLKTIEHRYSGVTEKGRTP